jgi:hypothetical protein
MRILVCAGGLFVLGCAAQLQVAGPYATQLSQSDVHQIVGLLPPSENISHRYTRLQAIHPDEVRVTVGGFGKSVKGSYTSDPAKDTFTAVKRRGNWRLVGPVEVERRITVY